MAEQTCWECYAVGSSRLLRKKRQNSVSDGRTRTALLGSGAMIGNENFEHLTLYQQGREQIEIAYLQAVNRDVVDPVVIVMDLREPLAMKLAEDTGQSDRVQAQIAEGERRGVVPTVFGGHPREGAKKLLAEYPDVVTAMDELTDPGIFLTIIVALGVASVRETPCVD